MPANEQRVLTMIMFGNIADGRRVSFMQRKYSPILISHETAKLIVGNMDSKASMQKKAFVKESLIVASKVKTKALRILS